jgi:cold shock CspA family protein
MVTTMPTGVLKFFNYKNGFGYITTAADGDVYVEASAVAESGLDRLRDGDCLSFEIAVLPNGKTRATNLTRVKTPRAKAEQHFRHADATKDNDPVRYGSNPLAAG